MVDRTETASIRRTSPAACLLLRRWTILATSAHVSVTTQAQVMELLMSIVKDMKKAMIVVTHNLGLVTRYADRIYVMYAGKVIESGTTEDIMKHPKHPYTIGLLKSVPNLSDEKGKALVPIEGAPPIVIDLPDRCAFFPRCPFATENCKCSPMPELRSVGEHEHKAACYIDMGSEQ